MQGPPNGQSLDRGAGQGDPAGSQIAGHSKEEPHPMPQARHWRPNLWLPFPWGYLSSHLIGPRCARVALPLDPWHKLPFLVLCVEMRMQAWSRPSPCPPYGQLVLAFT